MTRIIAATMVATLFTFYGVPDAEAKRRKKVKVVKKIIKVKPYSRYRYPRYKVPEQEYFSLNLGPGLGFTYYEQDSYSYPAYYHAGYGYPAYGYPVYGYPVYGGWYW